MATESESKIMPSNKPVKKASSTAKSATTKASSGRGGRSAKDEYAKPRDMWVAADDAKSLRAALYALEGQRWVPNSHDTRTGLPKKYPPSVQKKISQSQRAIENAAGVEAALGLSNLRRTSSSLYGGRPATKKRNRGD